ncbi:MAG: transferase [Desulfobulbus sp.]|nr:MAG: transferase [Desulfobulbus sp.]
MNITGKKIVIMGAGGHARVVADVIQHEGRFQLVGLIDSFQQAGNVCFGCTVLGGEDDLPELCRKNSISGIFVAVGDNYLRQIITDRILTRLPDLEIITTVHPSAFLGSGVALGEGTVIMPGALVISGSRIGRGCLVNTGSSLDHDSTMEDWSSLGPGAVSGGNVHIRQRTAVSLGARINHGITIGQDCVIGTGSVVVTDIEDGVVAYGVPCRVVRTRQPDESYL